MIRLIMILVSNTGLVYKSEKLNSNGQNVIFVYIEIALYCKKGCDYNYVLISHNKYRNMFKPKS